MHSHHFRLPGLVCAALTLVLELSPNRAAAAPTCPNLVVLLDQSASMARTPSGQLPQTGEKSKWDIAVGALTNLVNKYDGFLPLGYSNFPYRNASCDTRGFYIDLPGRDCTVGYGTKQPINDAMHAFPTAYPFTGGSTPTCTAISKLAAEMKLKDPLRAQYILLVTDGAPEVGCCPGDPVQVTVDAITAARSQDPPVKTIVVGFGVVASEYAALEAMAVAGGVPDMDSGRKFYLATDQAALEAKLASILQQIVGGDAGQPITCEDGCYGAGCPTGQACIQNQCKPNPCTSMTCGEGQHCLFDGNTASCVGSCARACPLGARCKNGGCVEDPCGGPCQPGEKCDVAQARCVTDAKCTNFLCHTSQACFDGKCVDDPCRYTTCPEGSQCEKYSGQCAPPRTEEDLSQRSGCECEIGGRHLGISATQIGPLGTLISMVILGALARRRRRTSSL